MGLLLPYASAKSKLRQLWADCRGDPVCTKHLCDLLGKKVPEEDSDRVFLWVLAPVLALLSLLKAAALSSW